jgi:hydrogenase expression/formation protein HypD
MIASGQIPAKLHRLHEAAAARARRRLAFMEVCGTHTMNAHRCGLHSLLPPNVSLLSGPGCPVCVTAPADIDSMIELAQRPDVIVCTYGDMLRVIGSGGMNLEGARSGGAKVRVVYSALDAVRVAASAPDQQVVFVAVGFETTAPASAALVLAAADQELNNLTLLVSHKRIVPAMLALTENGDAKIDGFLCPGHVAAVIGSSPFNAVVRRAALPCVIAGFGDSQICDALTALAELTVQREARLLNLYREAVRPWGNRVAMNLVRRVFRAADATWRGLGELPASGFVLRHDYQRFDAKGRFGLTEARNVPEPRGCRCGDVITGRCRPSDCGLFGRNCTPVHAIGPCMVSSEGTCQAWFKYARLHGLPDAAARGRRLEAVS